MNTKRKLTEQMEQSMTEDTTKKTMASDNGTATEFDDTVDSCNEPAVDDNE